jgi:IclR family pca regulon transcriptional regulator
MPRTRAGRHAPDEPAWTLQTLAEPRYSQSLERGLAILGCFTSSRPLLGIADIADMLGMSRSTTHRYVVTLLALGYLEQEGPARKYRLGLRVTDLGMAAVNSSGLRAVARPYLEELRALSSHTVALAALDETEITWLDVAVGRPHVPRRSVSGLFPGLRQPAHASAEGKLLLAHQPRTLQNALLAEMKLSKHGPRTITGKRALRDQFDQILADGIASADGEQALGVSAIAAPVRDGTRDVVAAVSISAENGTARPEELRERVGSHLVACADRVSTRLGFRRG